MVVTSWALLSLWVENARSCIQAKKYWRWSGLTSIPGNCMA